MATKPRAIFEEVGSETRPATTPGGIDAGRRDGRSAVRLWLMVLFALVVVMIAVGGLTRLTDSGLSITEWAPLSGTIPPLNDADWAVEFAAYQASPQYALANQGMELAAFKTIFWWEWSHRLLGRVIGAVWILGFVAIWAVGRMPPRWEGRLILIGVLIGLQGAIGWWMVHSGLQEGMTSVASYRLATHLGLAFVILGLIAWAALHMGRTEPDLMVARRAGEARLFGGATGLMHLAFLQILLGALVAGIDAGRAFPTWPLMGDGFFPPDPFSRVPLWRNFFEDAGLVQFIHRMAGYALFALGIVVWLRGRASANAQTRTAFHAVLGMLLVQVAIGIVTALYSAPLHIAILHQFGAVVLWVLILRARFLARYPLMQSVRGRI
jgi:heme a synthase